MDGARLGLQDGDGKNLCVGQYSERGKEKDSSVVDPDVDARIKAWTSLDDQGRRSAKSCGGEQQSDAWDSSRWKRIPRSEGTASNL